MDAEHIETQLNELSRRLKALPEVAEPPPTTLQVLGRGRREGYWQRLLVHFLTPDEPHGLGTDVLECFLRAVENHPDLDFEFSRLDLEEVEIESEVSTERGRPDLIIWSGEEWFLCIELKIDSGEGDDQTQRYVDVDSFADIDVAKQDIPTSGHHYLYLAPEDAPAPEATEFTVMPWQSISSAFRSFLQDTQGEYPFRTTVQLNDFVDTIRTELTMTEYKENRSEKVELAIEHYESINEVLGALEEFCDDLKQRWPDWFLEQSPEGWDDTWNTSRTRTYIHVYRDNWVVDRDVDDVKESGLYVTWEARIVERYIGNQKIVYRIKLKGTDEELQEKFRDSFYQKRNHRRVSETLVDIRNDPSKTAEIEDDNSNEPLVTGTYEFTFGGGDGVVDTYVEAFEDLNPVFEVISESIPE